MNNKWKLPLRNHLKPSTCQYNREEELHGTYRVIRHMVQGHMDHGHIAQGHMDHGHMAQGHMDHVHMAQGHMDYGHIAQGHMDHGHMA